VAYGKNKDDAWQSLHLELCRQFCGATLDSKTTGHQALDQVSGREENYQRTVFNLDCECSSKIYAAKVDEYETASQYFALYEVSNNGMFAPYFPPRDQKVVEAQTKIALEKEKETAKLTGILMADGHNVYSNGTKLNKYEVLSIMDNNPDAIKQYIKGLEQRKSGRNMQIVGSIIGIAGISVGTIVGTDMSMLIGYALVGGLGITYILLGTYEKAVGSDIIKEAVKTYNNSRSRRVSKVEWGFGITQQGLLGFVIKF
jgi:hypothetical protein